MKRKVLQLIMMITAGVALVVISVLAYSAAWYQRGVSHPYTFDILADGVIYVYMDAEVVHSDSALVPAVAMPGAISEGLPYDVLKTHDEDSGSYISKAASVTPVEGSFRIYNEGYGYEPIPLPKDPETGAVLFPKLDAGRNIEWVDPGDHSLGWKTMYLYNFEQIYLDKDDTKYYPTTMITEDVATPLLNSEGQIAWKGVFDYNMLSIYYYDSSYYESTGTLLDVDEDGYYLFPVCDDRGYVDGETYTTYYANYRIHSSSGPQYAPPIDPNTNKIIWKDGYAPTSVVYMQLDSDMYECAERPKETVHSATVRFDLGFKASDDPEVDDYFDPDEFVVNKVYFITKEQDETVPDQYKDGEGDRVRQYLDLAEDKKSGQFQLYGSEYFFVYAEIYLAQPDELLDPMLRNAKQIYMTVQISVEVQQYVDEEP